MLKLICLAAALFFQPFLAYSSPTDTPPNGEFTLDTEKSVIRWTGRKVTGEHTGVVNLSDGELSFNEGKIQGGSFSIDLTTLENKDLDSPVYKAKLEKHLRSKDFFDIKNFPIASFTITQPSSDKFNGSSAKLTINGDLTIKGATHPVEIVTDITTLEDSNLRSLAKIKIDRTLWGIKYNSGRAFSAAALGDKLIYDEIEIELDLVASPKNS